MRRGLVILILCLLMLATGLWALALAPASSLGELYGMPAHRAIGLLCFGWAGVAGTAGMLLAHNARGRLVRRLASMKAHNALARLESPHPDFNRLVETVNDLVEYAADAIGSAERRAKEMEIQLKVATAERQYLEGVIHSISDAVLVTDPFDEVVLANDSAARTFNFELAGASRAPIQRVLSDPAMVSLIRDMRQSDSRSGRRILEHSIPSPAGERTYKLTLSCISGQGGQPAGVVAVLHDMTREREVAKMKNDFVSHVSHELRTPLACIKAYTEMLIDGEAADEKTAHEFYEVIHNEANRLGRLIDNILNISRIESGLMRTNKRPISLMVTLKEVVEVITPQARQKQISIEERIPPSTCQAMADRDMLYEATLNLLSNAVKYTPENGRITVESTVDESKKKVVVRVSDTGVGIPPKDLPFIFDKFYRSEANSRMAKGTGLGLSLVKHIIETVHHGRMFAQSEVGKGSTFGFELDLVE